MRYRMLHACSMPPSFMLACMAAEEGPQLCRSWHARARMYSPCMDAGLEPMHNRTIEAALISGNNIEYIDVLIVIKC